eukprot:10093986-Lingulodinium_polyedra.AAC.1
MDWNCQHGAIKLASQNEDTNLDMCVLNSTGAIWQLPASLGITKASILSGEWAIHDNTCLDTVVLINEVSDQTIRFKKHFQKEAMCLVCAPALSEVVQAIQNEPQAQKPIHTGNDCKKKAEDSIATGSDPQ